MSVNGGKATNDDIRGPYLVADKAPGRSVSYQFLSKWLTGSMYNDEKVALSYLVHLAFLLESCLTCEILQACFGPSG